VTAAASSPRPPFAGSRSGRRRPPSLVAVLPLRSPSSPVWPVWPRFLWPIWPRLCPTSAAVLGFRPGIDRRCQASTAAARHRLSPALVPSVLPGIACPTASRSRRVPAARPRRLLPFPSPGIAPPLPRIGRGRPESAAGGPSLPESAAVWPNLATDRRCSALSLSVDRGVSEIQI
jgi:hypothetical protein